MGNDHCTYGSGFSWIGTQHRKQRKFIAAWQINTTCNASAYDWTAACRSWGSRSGITLVEWLEEEEAAFSEHMGSQIDCLRRRSATNRMVSMI